MQFKAISLLEYIRSQLKLLSYVKVNVKSEYAKWIKIKAVL